MPRTNPARRRELADAAIELLAASGVHGLTHRAVENAAGVPPGTASNYFRTREALLVAAAERIAELHHADVEEAGRAHTAASTSAVNAPPDSPAGVHERLTELLAGSLLAAATTHRTRYLAIFELQMEAVRRPALASALARLGNTATALTAGNHAELALPVPTERIPLLIDLYGGALFTLVTGDPARIDASTVHDLAHAIVQGALSEPAEA
ncbi:TetR/AcrR family transcriptional regulator [Thermomonospora amylolytica]|uniref:TetR/AcrR family transcriptional regulator n=1 Tax=Thermomonospora amylolytica TaxID=1411117 RepID=UPI000E6BE351|nr:TetR/AcrR family transcriptional regulator [Thermomonospora amylolytica]